MVSASPSLASSASGSIPSSRQDLARVALLVLERDPAVAAQRAADVRQRRQVPARAARPALGDEREHIVVEQVEDPLDQLDADARVALREAVGPQQHRHARDLGRRDRAGAAAHEADDPLLELAGLRGRDLAVRAVTEAGRDAVDRDLPIDQLALELAAVRDGVGGVVGEPHRAAAARDIERVGDRQTGAVELENCPLQPHDLRFR